MRIDYDSPDEVRAAVQGILQSLGAEVTRHDQCLSLMMANLAKVQDECPHARMNRTAGDVSGTPTTQCAYCGKVLEVGFGELYDEAEPEFDWNGEGKGWGE